MRGIRTLTLVLLTLSLSCPVMGEDATVGSLDEATAAFRQARKRLVVENLPLTGPEAERFWPLYERFQRDLAILMERRRALIAEFGENYDDMTDAAARKLVIDRLEYQEARYRLLRAYLPRFEKVLPAKKLARYFQIEGKIAAYVEAGIAEELPLIR